MPVMTQQQLETHLWGAATILRGRTAGQDYKTYILTLMFFKRLCDQWDYEAEATVRELEQELGQTFTPVQRERLLASSHIHRFEIPEECHWRDVLKVSTNIGQKLTAAMKGISRANKELAGVFTVDWAQPAPDGNGLLTPNEVVHALVQHFHGENLSNGNVQPDILGRSYEYLIKRFADDAGAKAGEFFTPPEVVDILIRILEPQPGETVYDPTCGSGGMLVHSADFLIENGHRPSDLRYFGQEMNWATYAIARINLILHGLEGDVRGGKSTITDPQFLKPDGSLEQFNVVIANFPFSDEAWWLSDEQRTEEGIKKAKKAGYTDPYKRFGFGKPPASAGDYAFIQHIIASANNTGRSGVVCPQGVLFRGQPVIEEETGEFDAQGNPKIRRRKADDEYLIRKGLLDARLIDAVIALPPNIFYGAGVPACLLILNKNRPEARRDQVLLIYAARQYRELSNQNQLRPQDVMRILVHYHAYGDPSRAEELVRKHRSRLQTAVTRQEEEDVARVVTEYQEHADRLASLEELLPGLAERMRAAVSNTDRARLEREQSRLENQAERPRKKLQERDERIAEVRKRAEEERQAIHTTGQELVAMYADPSELARHARVVPFEEIAENEHNLNIPRYVDTFEPKQPIDVGRALAELEQAEVRARESSLRLRGLLAGIGYASH